MSVSVQNQAGASRLQQFFQLTKPRVVALIVFTAVIGMLLSTPGMVPADVLVFGALGVWFVAGAAAAVNCLVDQKIDAVMARTRARPLPTGAINGQETLLFAAVVGGVGLLVLYVLVNPLTMLLTLATFVGYAVIYSIILKPLTSQNIVIGGASGAMPPVIGWAAATGEISHQALLLFLIIFAWTPPHFWALALYRKNEYAKAGVPMLPVTHGESYTRLHVLLYTIILFAVTLLPFAVQMSGWLYLFGAVSLGTVFLYYAIRICTAYSDALARRTFRYSIFYLSALFAILLIDHYWRV